ncbi:MAG: hypothetical protein K6A23_04535 [Butyrivibrio sp.]|nr:hypothetical protein [Butyrivibrio sp.]
MKKNKKKKKRILSLALIGIAITLIISYLCYWPIIEKKNKAADNLNIEVNTLNSEPKVSESGATGVKDEENTADTSSDFSNTLFESFLAGDIEAYRINEDGDGFTTVNIKDFNIDGEEWDSYSVYGYLDVDNDGEDELVLQGPYGACFFDAKDDKVTLFAEGSGTGATCLLAYYNKAYWIVTAHAWANGDDFYMQRYNGADNVAETFNFGSSVDENGNESYYRVNEIGEDISITKKDYTDLTNSIQPLS